MTSKEFFDQINTTAVKEPVVAQVEKIYGESLPDFLKKMISVSEESIFFDDRDLWRMLSPEEILHAEAELHVAFAKLKILPVIDCGENDFIVYHFAEGNWSEFNIVDETVFKIRDELTLLFH